MVDVSIEEVEDARTALARASRVVALTGAGISTASGIPDFRGPHGVWTLNPAAERASYADVYASTTAVREASWRALLAKAANPPRPNEAHASLVRFESTGRLSLVITQNIDGLHLEAGTSVENLIEIHGHTRDVRCLQCDTRRPTSAALKRAADGEEDPRCDEIIKGGPCGGILATTIVRFGEEPDRHAWRRAEQAVKTADLLLCVGSTLAVYPVAGLVPLALRYGARVIIVNDSPTEYDRSALCVRGDITEVLPALLAD